MKKNLYIVFTREPVPGRTKTRMMPRYSGEECCQMHQAFLEDIAAMAADTGSDVMVSYYSEDGEIPTLRRIFGDVPYRPQRGKSLEEKMFHAMEDGFAFGYQRCVLTGTDIPELQASTIRDAFELLDDSDVVLGPTADGGYYLIGMKKSLRSPFDIVKCPGENYIDQTICAVQNAGLQYRLTDSYHDMDYPEDLDGYMARQMSEGGAGGGLDKSCTAVFIRNCRKQAGQNGSE